MTSNTYIFAGSEKIKEQQLGGNFSTIFDKDPHLKAFTKIELEDLINRRINSVAFAKRELTYLDIMTQDCFNILFTNSGGLLKKSLSLIQDTVDDAILNNNSILTKEIINKTIFKRSLLTEIDLKGTEKTIFNIVDHKGKEMTTNEIEEFISKNDEINNLKRPTISFYVNKLVEKGYLKKNKVGREVYYSTNR